MGPVSEEQSCVRVPTYVLFVSRLPSPRCMYTAQHALPTALSNTHTTTPHHTTSPRHITSHHDVGPSLGSRTSAALTRDHMGLWAH